MSATNITISQLQRIGIKIHQSIYYFHEHRTFEKICVTLGRSGKDRGAGTRKIVIYHMEFFTYDFLLKSKVISEQSEQ